MVILALVLGVAAFFAAFGFLFLAAAKADSWLALVLFALCAVAVLALPAASWLQHVADGPTLALATAGSMAVGSVGLYVLHRHGATDRLAARLNAKK